MVQNRSQKRAQRKNEESMKTNNSPTFWLDFGCLRRWKIEEEIETKSVDNDSKSKGNFEADFQRIFVDFGPILEPKMDPKSQQKKTILSKIKINHTKSTQKNDVKKNKNKPHKINTKSTNSPHKIHTKTTQNPYKIHTKSTQNPHKIHT